MKLERLNYNKIRIFLTFDDLYEHGLTVDDIKRNELKVHAKIQRMVESACDEINFQMKGAIEIEIYSLHTQGLMMIITRDEEIFLLDDEWFNLQVTMEEQLQILYKFQSFEDLIQLCKILDRLQVVQTSSVFYYNDFYYLSIERIVNKQYDNVISLAAEYGSISTLTVHQLLEYGKSIVHQQAITKIASEFI
ncbi:adaptor protein MecA [Bacillus massiliigorillae]|uniref:adaptor protein MecA n=1 Tax=Bacillus massiliigorillae TaxID=1243664 RepID=UPI0003A79292|nr:adaptor protein MecA [Bacillus massiliigorillae]